MKRFIQLFNTIDQTNRTNEKVDALIRYFNETDSSDALWTIALFTGRHPKRLVKTTQLREWAAEAARLPLWLFEEAYHFTGDLSETIASVIPDSSARNEEHESLTVWMNKLVAMQRATDEQKKEFIIHAWQQFTKNERFVFNKLTSGAFRMGISQTLMTRALAKSLNKDEQHIAHRLMGDWTPFTTTFGQLLLNEHTGDEDSKPYPFYLAYAVEGEVRELGNISEWQAEFKWDGIRAQIIVRNNTLYIWSRGQELITDSFPELNELTSVLPDGTVLDGELLILQNGEVAPFQVLQTRISRKKVSAKLLADAPAFLYAYDVLELNGMDVRKEPLHLRRQKLEQLLGHLNNQRIRISPVLTCTNWDELTQLRLQSREQKSEGIMLKYIHSMYEVGRKKGNWWKWKVDPMTVDAVMIYAMSGSGRRANLFTDYTFAVKDDTGNLVPFAKAYSGLTDAEIKEVDAWIRKNTLEKFGPVRSVKAELVFELGFEAINFSTRHKSGVAVRFPRILRWRKDKPVNEIDTLAQLKSLITA
jgi:DNA ligase-1